MQHLLLSRPQLPVQQTELELVHHGGCERPKSLRLVVRESGTRHAVDDAHGSETKTSLSDQRGTGVEPDLRISGDQRILGETFVGGSVGHDEDVVVEDRVTAERDISRCLDDVQPHP